MAYNTNITSARKDLYKLTQMVINNGAEVNISTKHGNAILVSEDEYRSLLETLYLSSNKEYKQTIIDGKNTEYEDTVPEDEVKW